MRRTMRPNGWFALVPLAVFAAGTAADYEPLFTNPLDVIVMETLQRLGTLSRAQCVAYGGQNDQPDEYLCRAN